jgi:glycosyltransferase involved in cell wall biosynthesis
MAQHSIVEKPPLLSVLMPVFNSSKYVAQAVDSILNQSFRDFEFVIVDDGSSDGSPQILDHYASLDQRVRIVHQPNSGITVALTNGFEESRGEFLARMDSDDVAEPTRLEKQLTFIKSNPELVLVGTSSIYIDPSGREVDRPNVPSDHNQMDSWHASGMGTALGHPTAMIRRTAFVTVGGYRQEFEPAEDLDLWLRLAEVGQIANVPEALVRYRIHPESVSQQRRKAQSQAVWRAVRSAAIRRSTIISDKQFTELGEDGQTSWISLALDLGYSRTAFRWAIRRLTKRPCLRRVKQLFKVLCGRHLKEVLFVYDRLHGRRKVRTTAFES